MEEILNKLNKIRQFQMKKKDIEKMKKEILLEKKKLSEMNEKLNLILIVSYKRKKAKDDIKIQKDKIQEYENQVKTKVQNIEKDFERIKRELIETIDRQMEKYEKEEKSEQYTDLKYLKMRLLGLDFESVDSLTQDEFLIKYTQSKTKREEFINRIVTKVKFREVEEVEGVKQKEAEQEITDEMEKIVDRETLQK